MPVLFINYNEFKPDRKRFNKEDFKRMNEEPLEIPIKNKQPWKLKYRPCQFQSSNYNFIHTMNLANGIHT